MFVFEHTMSYFVQYMPIYISAKRCQKLERLELYDMKFITCELMDTCCTNGLKFLTYIRFLATPIAPGCIHLLYGKLLVCRCFCFF